MGGVAPPAFAPTKNIGAPGMEGRRNHSLTLWLATRHADAGASPRPLYLSSPGLGTVAVEGATTLCAGIAWASACRMVPRTTHPFLFLKVAPAAVGGTSVPKTLPGERVPGAHLQGPTQPWHRKCSNTQSKAELNVPSDSQDGAPHDSSSPGLFTLWVLGP